MYFPRHRVSRLSQGILHKQECLLQDLIDLLLRLQAHRCQFGGIDDLVDTELDVAFDCLKQSICRRAVRPGQGQWRLGGTEGLLCDDLETRSGLQEGPIKTLFELGAGL